MWKGNRLGRPIYVEWSSTRKGQLHGIVIFVKAIQSGSEPNPNCFHLPSNFVFHLQLISLLIDIWNGPIGV